MVVTASWIERLFDGSLVEGTAFLIIGIAGAILLLISILLDGIFEVFDFGDGPLSLTTIAAFTAIFGFSAFAAVGGGLPGSVASIIGAIAGLVGGALAWWLSRLIRSAESSTTISSGELIGSEASVVLGIPLGGLGEVALVRHGERVSLSASAATEIPHGARVRITQTLTANSVRVEVVPEPGGSDPVSSDPAGSDPADPGATHGDPTNNTDTPHPS